MEGQGQKLGITPPDFVRLLKSSKGVFFNASYRQSYRTSLLGAFLEEKLSID